MHRGRRLPTLLILFAAMTWAQQPAASPSPSQAPGSAASPGAKIDPASGLPICPSALSKNDTNPVEVEGEMVERVGSGVTAPKLKNRVRVEIPKESRKAMQKQHVDKAAGLLAFVVGVDGKPKDVCLEKSAGFGLDTVAAEAAMKYRFEPAMQGGKPVPVIIHFTVNFKLI